ncbi:MAG TPA: glycosyltransferase [Pseudidiomarina sp.]|nr:glycosyltransferase [Pseudidiomarina sp.]
MKRVSVYMPTHNRRDLLQRAVESVQAQTHSEWELIIVNDASTDDTADYLAALAAQDSRIHVLTNETSLGACGSRNRAIEAATGEFVTGLDDDDTFHPQRLEKMVAAFASQYAFVCTGFYWVTATKRKRALCSRKVIQLDDQLLFNEATNQVLTTRERMLAIGGFDPEFVALQDYDCFTRLIRAFGPGLRIEEPLQDMYVDHGGVRISNHTKSYRGFEQFAAKHGAEMTEQHRVNHEFLLKSRVGESITFAQLWRYLRAGSMPLRKLNYYLKHR